MADGLADGGQVVGPAIADSIEGAHNRVDGEAHVGAGVAVGDGVDVQAVDGVLMGSERVPVVGDDGLQVACPQPLERLHARMLTSHGS